MLTDTGTSKTRSFFLRKIRSKKGGAGQMTCAAKIKFIFFSTACLSFAKQPTIKGNRARLSFHPPRQARKMNERYNVCLIKDTDAAAIPYLSIGGILIGCAAFEGKEPLAYIITACEEYHSDKHCKVFNNLLVNRREELRHKPRCKRSCYSI